jgi:hypothetical protein
MKHPLDNYYEYRGSEMIVCGECLDKDLAATKRGDLVGDERIFPGRYLRLKDDHTEAYQCDGCGVQNEPYEQLGELP